MSIIIYKEYAKIYIYQYINNIKQHKPIPPVKKLDKGVNIFDSKTSCLFLTVKVNNWNIALFQYHNYNAQRKNYYAHTDRTGDYSPYHINRHMVDFGIKRPPGTCRFPHSRKVIHNLSPLHGTGYTDAFLAPIVAGYTFYYIIR